MIGVGYAVKKCIRVVYTVIWIVGMGPVDILMINQSYVLYMRNAQKYAMLTDHMTDFFQINTHLMNIIK